MRSIKQMHRKYAKDGRPVRVRRGKMIGYMAKDKYFGSLAVEGTLGSVGRKACKQMSMVKKR